MDVITALSAIKLALDLADELMEPEKVQKYREVYERFAANTPTLKEAEELLDKVLAQITAAREMRRLQIGQTLNPAFRIPKPAVLLLAVGLAIGVSACCRHGQVRYLPERTVAGDTYRDGYGVEWPTDASRDPADYATIEVEGVMQTTVPIRPVEPAAAP